MKVVELTRRETISLSCFDTWRPRLGRVWSNGYEDHRLGVEIGRLAGVDYLAVLVDVYRENPVRPVSTNDAAASECGRDDVRIARVALELNRVALEVAGDPEAFQFVVG